MIRQLLNISLLLSSVLFLATGCGHDRVSGEYDRILLSVKRNYKIPREAEQVRISVVWDSIASNLKTGNSIHVVGQDFGVPVDAQLVDTNTDGKPDYLEFDYTFSSNEPIFTFLVTPGPDQFEVVPGQHHSDGRLECEILRPFALRGDESPYDLSRKLVESSMHAYPDIRDFPVYAPNKWNYEYGFFFTGSFMLGEKLSEPSYINFAQRYMDNFADPSGGFRNGVYKMDEYKLDDILPGRLAILLYQLKEDPKYKSIADTLRKHLQLQPKTTEGGYWHKLIYEHQMWLDGIFMADVFSMQYASAFNNPELFDEAAHQIKLVYSHTHDPETGLMYHGWDEAKNPVWADPVKGTSPEFWGRAVGWYMMALVECLDYLPEDHPDRSDIVNILIDLSSSVLRVQDKESGLWFQVLDKGSRSGNWIETSCSAMFAYAFAKGNRLGLLDDSYKAVADTAVNTLFDQYVYADLHGDIHLNQTVKVGTLNVKNSKGDFDYYVTTERRLDDYKGIAALLFACMELKK